MIRNMQIFSAAVVLATTAGVCGANAEKSLVQFQRGILCDNASQVEEIISRNGITSLQDAVDSLNSRTGKLSCGVVSGPVLFYMEPLRVVSASVGRVIIVKLTDPAGVVQYAWRVVGKTEGLPA